MWKALVFIIIFIVLCLAYDAATKNGVDPNLMLIVLGIILMVVISKL